MRFWLAAMSMVLTAVPAMASDLRCDLPKDIGASALDRILSLRAVELVRGAQDSESGLARLVDPAAEFSLGAGDVGRPLGTGPAGARELAQAMHADTYRFLGWDYMDLPVDACAAHKVEVEFIDGGGRSLSHVEFGFKAGRVVYAKGWMRSFEMGPLAGSE